MTDNGWMPDNCRAQPVSTVQWLDRELLDANDYNPNRVAPPELRLLAISILEDGWTQPLVVRPTGDTHQLQSGDGPAAPGAPSPDGRYEIVDGFHRWTVAAWREVPRYQREGGTDVWALTDGLVPCVVLERSPGDQRMSTIRHNRARGVHHVVRMADIVVDLVDAGVPEAEIQRRLSMDAAEVRRLIERGNMLERGRAEELGEAWRPAPGNTRQ